MSLRHIRGREDIYVIGRCDAREGELRWKAGHRSLHTPRTESRVEWSLFRKGHGVGFMFGRNGSDSHAGLDIFLGRIGSVWLRTRTPWTEWLKVRDRESKWWYEARHTGFRLRYFKGHIVTVMFDCPDGASSRAPRQWSLSTWQVVGRTTCTTEVLETGMTRVPLPEGAYPAEYKVEKRTWRHQRYPGKVADWFGVRVRTDVSLSIPGGIPVEGKGENSYDCGMDGLFGCGGATVEAAVANAVKSVMRDRNRYGGPHDLTEPTSVADAEARS
jgi:hypothetical protein